MCAATSLQRPTHLGSSEHTKAPPSRRPTGAGPGRSLAFTIVLILRLRNHTEATRHTAREHATDAERVFVTALPSPFVALRAVRSWRSSLTFCTHWVHGVRGTRRDLDNRDSMHWTLARTYTSTLSSRIPFAGDPRLTIVKVAVKDRRSPSS